MARTTINELKQRRLARGSAAERATFDETYAAAAIALRAGERIGNARKPADRKQPAALDPDSYLE